MEPTQHITLYKASPGCFANYQRDELTLQSFLKV